MTTTGANPVIAPSMSQIHRGFPPNGSMSQDGPSFSRAAAMTRASSARVLAADSRDRCHASCESLPVAAAVSATDAKSVAISLFMARILEKTGASWQGEVLIESSFGDSERSKSVQAMAGVLIVHPGMRKK